MLAQTTTTSPGANAAVAVFMLFYAAVLLTIVVGWVKILSKAGYSGWWVLIGIVPLVNIVMFLVFAFSRWPVLQQSRPGPLYGYPPPGYVPQPPGSAPPGSAPPASAPPAYGPPPAPQQRNW